MTKKSENLFWTLGTFYLIKEGVWWLEKEKSPEHTDKNDKNIPLLPESVRASGEWCTLTS